MQIDFQGSQKMYIWFAISQNEMVKKLYQNNLQLYTLQSVKVVIAPGLETPPGTM